MRAEGGPYVAAEITLACSGVLLCGDPATRFAGITTDSRDIKKDDLFVPLRGANFDGHYFLLPALEAGARGALADRDTPREIYNSHTNHVLIQVKDTLRALSDLASAHRTNHSIPLIAVTGSSGKTTVKEMIAVALRRSRRPLVSHGNYNNLVGLPMTVLNLGPQHSAAVVEAGINIIGEMDSLAHAARPDVAVITTVGPVHLEGLGSVENVAREKFKLVQGLAPGGLAVLPAGNEYLAQLLEQWGGESVAFGVDEGDFRASDISLGDLTRFRMLSPYGTQEIELHVPGRHNIANALAAAAACTRVGIDLAEIRAALSEFRPPELRMEILPLPGDRTLIRDCYNANPQSVAAALEVLVSRGSTSKTLAILADMAELGDQAAQLHRELGTKAAALGVSRLVFVGSYGSNFREGFVSAGGAREALTLAADKEAAWSAIGDELGNFSTILVKGSRVMKMELIAGKILEGN